MTYEVLFQHEGAEYIVRGPDIDGVLRLIQGVQGAEVVPEHEDRRDAAETTLKGLNYEWRGGAQWAPPIGPKPAFLDDIRPGWVEWSGGVRPMRKHEKVIVMLRNGNEIPPTPAHHFDWEHCAPRATDIVRYRVCA